MGAWAGCHRENPVKLSILGFEMNGKDGFRVHGEDQASPAQPGLSVSPTELHLQERH